MASCKMTVRYIPEPTAEIIQECVKQLKNNKAGDQYGISSEHLKYAGPSIINLLIILIKKIVHTATVPNCTKTGLITPVFKNKNSNKMPDNYRRITVTSLVGKVIEKFLVAPTKTILRPNLNLLQRGFCENSSSLNTAFLLTETIADAKDNNIILFTTFLDASKAFDVVWHNGMMRSLHELGISGNLWLLYKDMYHNMTSRVKWEGQLSESFEEMQGVRQGGIPSTELFKTRCNKLLKNLEDSGMGYHIGTISVAAPTCADDVVLVSSSPTDLQAMINIAQDDAHAERYTFSTTKTKAQVVNTRRPAVTWQAGEWWKLNNNPIEVSMVEKHLGINRDPSGKATATVDENIKNTRRCMYAMCGVGSHGLNGQHPEVSAKLYKTYALPRLTYGLELMTLSKANIRKLELCQREILRRIEHLPQGTANCALCLLLGILPVQAIIERNTIILFRTLVMHEGSKERDIIIRQLAIKDRSSSSWVIKVKDLLTKYDLPTAYTVLENPPPRDQWRRQVKNAVAEYWLNELKQEASTMKTLVNMDTNNCAIGELHPVWKQTPYNKWAILQASVKVKIVVGRYLLQEDYNKYSGGSARCPLCHKDQETLLHFLLQCDHAGMTQTREKHLETMRNIVLEISCENNWNLLRSNPNLLIQLIIDPSHSSLDLDRRHTYKLEAPSRSMLHALHTCRTVALAADLPEDRRSK